jgi:hypothetical protein
MIRKSFRIAWVLSLLFCVASVVLWVRSYWWNAFVAYDAAVTAKGVQRQYYVDTYEGTVHFARLRSTDPASRLPGPRLRLFNAPITSHSTLTGARYWVAAGAGYRYQHVTLPCWMITAAFATWPGWTIIARARRARRSTVGTCPRCSYNLTGNTSGVCPECGTAVVGKAAAWT